MEISIQKFSGIKISIQIHGAEGVWVEFFRRQVGFGWILKHIWMEFLHHRVLKINQKSSEQAVFLGEIGLRAALDELVRN